MRIFFKLINIKCALPSAVRVSPHTSHANLISPSFRFATFVLSLYQIIADLVYFLIVLALFMLMFGNCFIVYSSRATQPNTRAKFTVWRF